MSRNRIPGEGKSGMSRTNARRSVMTRSSRYLEGIVAVELRVFLGERRDAASSRARAKPLEISGDGIRFPLDDRLDASVRAVADPSCHAGVSRGPLGEEPESDSLDAAGENGPPRDHRTPPSRPKRPRRGTK